MRIRGPNWIWWWQTHFFPHVHSVKWKVVFPPTLALKGSHRRGVLTPSPASVHSICCSQFQYWSWELGGGAVGTANCRDVCTPKMLFFYCNTGKVWPDRCCMTTSPITLPIGHGGEVSGAGVKHIEDHRSPRRSLRHTHPSQIPVMDIHKL